jgi:hypothetical protein
MPYEDDEVYTEWLAAAPKGVRWEKAQEMYQVYQERRRVQAEELTRKLLGKRICPACKGSDLVLSCSVCGDTGEVNARATWIK